MSVFCSKCGAQLKDNSKFCPACGASVNKITQQPQAPSCLECGAQLKSNSKFCPRCGQTIKAAPQFAEAKTETKHEAAKEEQNAEEKRSFLQELLYLVKHPWKLLPMIVISIIWILLSIFSTTVSDVPVLGVLAALTFSNGGMYGGVFGAIGGIFGKAVFGAVLNAFVLALFEKQNPFKGFGEGFRRSTALSGLSAIAPYVIGAGAGILLYLFFNITSDPMNCAVAVVAALAAIKAAGTQNGILFSILFGVLRKITKGKTPSQLGITQSLTGFSAGFAIALPITFARMPLVMLIVGAALLALGIVCAFVGKLGKKGAAALSIALFMAVGSASLPFGMLSVKAEKANTKKGEEIKTGGFTIKAITLDDTSYGDDAYDDHDREYYHRNYDPEVLYTPLYYIFTSVGDIKVTESDDGIHFTVPTISTTGKYTSPDSNSSIQSVNYSITSSEMSFSAPLFAEHTFGGDISWYMTYVTLDNPATLQVTRTYNYKSSDPSTSIFDISVNTMYFGCSIVQRKDKPSVIGIGDVYTGGTLDNLEEAYWTGGYTTTSVYSSGQTATSDYHVAEERDGMAEFGYTLYFDAKGLKISGAEEEEKEKSNNGDMPKEIGQIIMISILTSLLGGGTGALLTAIAIVLGNTFTFPPIPPAPTVPKPPTPPKAPKEDLGPYIKRDSDGDLNVKDPATGETRVYVSNGDGTYTNPLTGATYTPQELKDSLDSRADNADQIRQDQKAAQDAINQHRLDNQNLSQDAKDYLEQKHKEEAKQKEEDKIFKNWLKYGGSDDWRDTEATRQKMNERQATNIKLQEGAHRVASHLDTVVKVAETTQVAADIGVDVLATVTGAQGIKTAYTVGKNYASRLSDAVVNNKDISGAIAMAGFDSLADIAMDKLENAGYHVSGNAAGDTFKQITQNLYDGKDWNDGLAQAAIKGGAKGFIAKAGSAMQTNQANITKDQLKTDLYTALKAQNSGMSAKGVRTLRDMRLITYVNNTHAEAAVNVGTTIGVDLGKTAVDGISDAYSEINDALDNS